MQQQLRRCGSGAVGVHRSLAIHRPISSGVVTQVSISPACSISSASIGAASSLTATALQQTPRPVASIVSNARGSVITQASSTDTDTQVVVETLSACVRKLRVTVPGTRVQSIFHKTVNTLQKDIVGTLKGFRNNKPLPLGVIVQNVGGQRNFKMAIIEQILIETVPQACESLGPTLVPESERIVTDVSAMEAAFDPAKPFSFELEAQVAPPLAWKKSHKELEVTIRDTGDMATDTAAAEGLIRKALRRGGFSRVVADRGLERGDSAVIDLQVKMVGDRSPLPGLSKDKVAFETEEDPLGLSEGMVAMKTGESRTIPFTFPDDYSVELWQGRKAEARVTLRELFAWVLPAFDDAFVAKHHSDFGSADEMRKALLATTAMERLQVLDGELEMAVRKAVVDAVDVPEVPEALVTKLAERQFEGALLRMVQDGVASHTQVEGMCTPAMLAEFTQKRRREIEGILIFNMAVDSLAELEAITPDEEEVQAQLKQELAALQAQAAAGQRYDPDILLGDIRETYLTVKVTEWLKDNVKRTVLPWNEAAPSASA